LLRKGNEGLLTGHPFLNEVLIWDKSAAKYKNLIDMIKKIRSRQYELVINLHRFLNTGILTVCSGALKTTGFSKNPLSIFFSYRYSHIFKENVHETDRNLTLLSNLLKSDRKYLPKLYPSQTDFDKTTQETPYITISPTSVWFTKQYPQESWVEMLNGLDENFKAILLGGKPDVDSCIKIKAGTTHRNVEVMAGKLSFLESAALMKNAVMNYTNDSAPLHLASAMNAPVTAVFCSTVPSFGFGPLSSVSHVIETKEKLYCRPCGIHGNKQCPESHFKCAVIAPRRLLETIPES